MYVAPGYLDYFVTSISHCGLNKFHYGGFETVLPLWQDRVASSMSTTLLNSYHDFLLTKNHGTTFVHSALI